MRFFTRISDEEMAKGYAEDITAKANALVKENEDKEVALRLKIIGRAIEQKAFCLFFGTPNLNFSIYAPTEKAELAQDIVRSIMAAMHIQETNEDETYKGNHKEHRPEIR